MACVSVSNFRYMVGLFECLQCSERDRYVLSPVRLSSVTLVRPTQAIQIFGNISTALGTLAIQ